MSSQTSNNQFTNPHFNSSFTYSFSSFNSSNPVQYSYRVVSHNGHTFSEFTTRNLNSNPPNNNNQNNQQTNSNHAFPFNFFNEPLLFSNFMGGFSNHNSFFGSPFRNDGLEQILNHIMQNDPNNYGTPPASKQEVEKLEKTVISEENSTEFKEKDCSVCRENYKIDEKTIKMPCNHVFHEDCLMPWLKQHNSCPVCRFELKTDDVMYENRKNTQTNQQRSCN
jgi:E3 ubiquitin-protein ligase RNF115/126